MYIYIYVDRSDFELLETGADSLYFAISGPILESVIKLEYKEYRVPSGRAEHLCCANFIGCLYFIDHIIRSYYIHTKL